MFKKAYTVRRHGKQTANGGYAGAPYSDIPMMLNIQPLSPDEMQALPEGDRTVRRVKSFGSGRMAPADEFDGVPGDRLFYQGLWHECVSSATWDHTPLGHYRSEFVLLPPHEQEEPPEGGAGP